MQQVKLIIAVKRTIMQDTGIAKFRKEWAEFTPEDKKDLVKVFNEEKPLGAEVEVIL